MTRLHRSAPPRCKLHHSAAVSRTARPRSQPFANGPDQERRRPLAALSPTGPAALATCVPHRRRPGPARRFIADAIADCRCLRFCQPPSSRVQPTLAARLTPIRPTGRRGKTWCAFGFC